MSEKRITTIYIDTSLYEWYANIYGTRSLSGLINSTLAKMFDEERLKGHLICMKCNKKSHINIVVNNGGFCQWTACKNKLYQPIKKIEV